MSHLITQGKKQRMQNHICTMVMFLCVHVNKDWVTRTDFKGLLESEVTIGLE